MEGSLSLNITDEITLHLDHKVHGQHRPCTVFLSSSEGRIGIGINIIGQPHHDDVGIEIENGRLVTVQVRPVHAFHRQFCIDGPAADLDHDKTDEPAKGLTVAQAAENLAAMTLSLNQTDQKDEQDQADLPSVRLRYENQALVEAVKQIEQKRKNEQGSRIYYQELVQSIRAVMVEGCKQARGCKTDDLPAFVKAAITLAHQKSLGQAIANIKGHHGN